MTRALPKEIYLVTNGYKSQVYTSKGRARAALKTNGSFNGARRDIEVYVVVVDPHGMVPLDIGEDGWTDVTHEFRYPDGVLLK